MLGLELCGELVLAAPALRIGGLGESQDPVRVTVAQRVVDAALLDGERADRLEEVEALAVGAHEALVRERRERVELRAADRLGAIQREAAREDPEP